MEFKLKLSCSLGHALKIPEAMPRGAALHHILSAHLYGTGSKFIAAALDACQKDLQTFTKVPTVSIVLFLVYKRAINEKGFFRQNQVFLKALHKCFN